MTHRPIPCSDIDVCRRRRCRVLIREHCTEIVRRLLEKGAEVDRVTSILDTPLHGSVTGNKPDITAMLIKAGN